MDMNKQSRLSRRRGNRLGMLKIFGGLYAARQRGEDEVATYRVVFISRNVPAVLAVAAGPLRR